MKLTAIILLILFLSAYLVMPVQAFTINKGTSVSGAFSTNPLANKNNKQSSSLLTESKVTETKQINAQALNYEQLITHNNKPYLWFNNTTNNNKLNLSGLSLLSLLNDLGINVMHSSDIVNLASQSNKQIKAIDQQLTQQLYTIATLFNGYQFKPLEKPKEDIFNAVENQQLATYLDQLLPQFDQVVRLRTAIAYYQKLAKKPWPIIDDKLSLVLGQGHKEVIKLRSMLFAFLGQGHKEVIKLRSMLFALTDLKKRQRSRYRQHIFDPEIVTALKKFQTRHGLKADGKLNTKTIQALNINPIKRIEIMQINLWRWLSLPSIPPTRYVMVNIPAYRLYFIENQQQTLTMRVIVGDNQHQTPIMVTQVSSLTVNPQWTPTYNIIHKELLVENARNPGSLKRQNFKLAKGYGAKQVLRPVFKDSTAIKNALGQYKLVQAAGRNNALGKYRFNIKNFHSVYLHDTPAKNLFSKKNRALSHGCVRLQSANLLAKKFMINEGKNKQKQVNKSLSVNKTQHIKLSKSIAVYLTYQTVWLTDSGQVQWLEDIYQQDVTARLNTVQAQLSSYINAASNTAINSDTNSP